MDTYVVHIFRRPDAGSGALVGLIERIGDGKRKAFHDQAQLLEYLIRERPKRRPVRGSRNTKDKA